MEFLLLGPLEVRRGGDAVEVRGAKRRTLLAMLVLHANEVVRADRLVDELWGEHPPSNVASALQSHVSRLRKDVVGTKPWGYVLRADPQTIDLRRFEALVAEARTLPAEERGTALRVALALWRGPPLADLVNEPALAGHIERLQELQLSALEQRIDADLETGTHSELVPELESLVARQPLRERLRGQLILALYRAGRQAEALETYRETRRVLVDELGIEPSAELRELERAILRQDPALTVAHSAPTPTPPDDRGRWRWPRSPLVVGAALVLLGAGGIAAAIVSTRGGSQPAQAVGATEASSDPGTSPSNTVVAPTAAGTHPPSVGAHPATVRARTRPPKTRQPTPAAPPASKRGQIPPELVTRTHVSTTTAPSEPAPTGTAPATGTPPARWVWWLADDFEDPEFDFATWHLATHGSGVTAAEQNGQLELSVLADPVAEPIYGFDTHYGTECLLTGDFDARVEYRLRSWPAMNGMSVGFGAYFPQGRDTGWAFIGRQGQPANGGPDSYNSSVGRGHGGVQTADSAGSLRLKRANGVLTTFYRYRDRWVKLAAGTARGPTNLILTYSGNLEQFGHQAAIVAFDNFQADAETVECNGVPPPPRKRVRTP